MLSAQTDRIIKAAPVSWQASPPSRSPGMDEPLADRGRSPAQGMGFLLAP